MVEVFGVVEFAIPRPTGFTEGNRIRVMLDGRVPCPVAVEGGLLRFRFSPRDAKVWRYRMESYFAGLEGVGGAFTAERPPLERTGRASLEHPNWWCDDPAPENAEGIHAGARSVSQWRMEFLEDFAVRMERCVVRSRRG